MSHDHLSTLWLLALFLTSGGAIAWLITRASFHAAEQIFPLILPAYRMVFPYFNRPLVDFTMIVLWAGGGLGIYWLTDQLPWLKAFTKGICWPNGLPLATLQLLIACKTPSWSSATLFTASAIVLIRLSFTTTYGLDRQQLDNRSAIGWLVSKALSTSTILLLLAASIAAIGLFAWYPVVLPNDYYELSETIALPSSATNSGHTAVEISRPDFIKFDLAPRMQFKTFLEQPRPKVSKILRLRIEYPDEFAQFLMENGLAPDTKAGLSAQETAAAVICGRSSKAPKYAVSELCSLYLDELQPNKSETEDAVESNRNSLVALGKASPSYFSLLINAKKWQTEDPLTGEKTQRECQIEIRTEPRCNFPRLELDDGDLPSLDNAMHNNGVWIVQAGRLLFHHSYLFVPAVHFLKYGFDGNVAYLYGVGNTLFHAALLKITQPTLQSYFNTYPIAQYLGLILIAALIFVITQSYLAAITAFTTAVAAMYCISAETVFLAPGFSPLRYAGLSFQIATIFLALRGHSSFRLAALPAAFVLSFLWNTEYAFLGLVGQMLVLAAPSLKLTPTLRVGCLASMLIVPSICWYAARTTNPDIIANVQVGFFGIGLPILPAKFYVGFLIVSGAAVAAMILLARQFPPTERDARLSLAPVTTLVAIKFLFNPALPHLFFAMVLVFPLIIAYVPWLAPSKRTGPSAPGRENLENELAMLVVASLVFFTGPQYKAEKALFNTDHISYFNRFSWSSFGDPIATVMPPGPLNARIEALRSEMKMSPTVLLLSPFDHVLSFYTNPQRYCGNFELLTNLVFQADLDSIIACAKRHADLLVVYDDAIEMLCPNQSLHLLYDMNGCKGKKLLKDTLREIMLALLPAATDLSKVGSLTFFRLDPEKLATISAADIARNAKAFPIYEGDD